MGTDLNTYKVIMFRPNGYYRVEGIPETDPNFIHYFVKAHQATGVCAVIGGTKSLETFGKGENIREEFKRLKAIFDNKYGEVKTYDFVIKGDRKLWEDNFMSKYSMGEAFLGAVWDYDRGIKNLGKEIKKIVLYIKKEQGYNYNVIAFYEFNNINECRRNITPDEEPMKRIK